MIYFAALALTLAVEAPIVALGYRKNWLLPFVAVNLFTHGLLWMVKPRHLILAEIAIALVEAGLYARLLGGGMRRALVVSLLANALSLAAGLAVF